MKKFTSGMEMYEFLLSGRDLYSKNMHTYAFVYNDAGAICIYAMYPEDAVELVEKSKEYGDYWGAFLGWYGSGILDEPKFDEYRYTDNWELHKLYLEPTLTFCEETYMEEDWMDTDDVTVGYLLGKGSD